MASIGERFALKHGMSTLFFIGYSRERKGRPQSCSLQALRSLKESTKGSVQSDASQSWLSFFEFLRFATSRACYAQILCRYFTIFSFRFSLRLFCSLAARPRPPTSYAPMRFTYRFHSRPYPTLIDSTRPYLTLPVPRSSFPVLTASPPRDAAPTKRIHDPIQRHCRHSPLHDNT